MKSFDLIQANQPNEAVTLIQSPGITRYIAGGTNILDLMKYEVESADTLVDINRLPFQKIEKTSNGLRIGALVRNSDVSADATVTSEYPLLAQALLSGASQQLRNMATVGGNLMQRTRCYYFYDPSTPCNKRNPGSGCGALEGYNRIHAILGASKNCIAVNPSDQNVALAALDAVVQIKGSHGDRQIPVVDFHRLPGDTPQFDTVLQPGELITAVDLPAKQGGKSYYLKIRDRASYAFALVSVAVWMKTEGSMIRDLRIALGGVAHKPWRKPELEQAMINKPATVATYRELAQQLLSGAKGFEHNSFKIKLAESAIVRALETVS